MAYNALYRRFRPERFGEIIGQPHITQILLNQVRSGRVAHAYLFCGSRGTGKTSTARILARAINCLSPEDGEPCGKCSACLSENSVDVIELDAASNSGVDDMRALIERAEFAPLDLKKKVYIIDEAHMLTRNASNALLKTLEEPPEHVVFILATTEPQMLPATIVSRCQRFEFHRLRVSEMVDSMKRSLSSIGAHIDDEGLIAIARAAEGGMRDCLSIADQCLSFCGGNVTLDDVLSVLGSVGSDFLRRAVDAVASSDSAGILRFVDDVVRSGRDLGVFSLDLAARFRAILLANICGDCRDILDCTEEMMRDYMEQAKTVSAERATRAVEELLKLQSDLKLAASPRTLLESTLLRISRPEDEAGLLALSDRVSELNREIEELRKNGVTVTAQPAQKEAIEEQVPVEDEGFVQVPDMTRDADELFNKFMEGMRTADPTAYYGLRTSAAHWTENGVLHICFDIMSENMYNYSVKPETKQKINETAKACIAPYTVAIDLKDRRQVRQNTVTELFGVPIIEE